MPACALASRSGAGMRTRGAVLLLAGGVVPLAAARQGVRDVVLRPADARLAEPFTRIHSIRELADGRVLISDNSVDTRLVVADLRRRYTLRPCRSRGSPDQSRHPPGLRARRRIRPAQRLRGGDRRGRLPDTAAPSLALTHPEQSGGARAGAGMPTSRPQHRTDLPPGNTRNPIVRSGCLMTVDAARHRRLDATHDTDQNPPASRGRCALGSRAGGPATARGRIHRLF
jgi:hypothetical protein